ncbi:unknown protein [Microcystis aeruginosa NIES-843]|uniref:Uncharacterized protein n=1 Tax=Microcystis aeruginosa (strain NIES-843 / IAM M-2473) TaxID=449447 RepID=B0JXR1_MICAN|nr:unknown protein [Microcystis aeruginosa NIES-843]
MLGFVTSTQLTRSAIALQDQRSPLSRRNSYLHIRRKILDFSRSIKNFNPDYITCLIIVKNNPRTDCLTFFYGCVMPGNC